MQGYNRIIELIDLKKRIKAAEEVKYEVDAIDPIGLSIHEQKRRRRAVNEILLLRPKYNRLKNFGKA